jgi:hypothetical protein
MSGERQTVAQLLRDYRLEADWPSLREIGAIAGLRASTCGNILNGSHDGTLASVTKIAEALGGDVTAAQECWLHRDNGPEPMSFDEETRVMEDLVQGFGRLPAGARERVIRYLVSRFGIQLEQ